MKNIQNSKLRLIRFVPKINKMMLLMERTLKESLSNSDMTIDEVYKLVGITNKNLLELSKVNAIINNEITEELKINNKKINRNKLYENPEIVELIKQISDKLVKSD